MSLNQAKARHARLVEEIRRHDHEYYVLGQEAVSDYEYDRLYQELLDLEKEDPKLVTADSPSQRVGGQPVEGFPRVRHILPMLSLEKIKASKRPDEKEEPDVERRKRLQDQNTLTELKGFDATLQKQLGKGLIEYVVEPKVDGVSIGVHYENGKLTLGVTRGDGTTGDDITSNIKTIRGIPFELRLKNPPALLEVRGEAYIPREKFEKLNSQMESAGERPFPNARNATAGTLKQLDPRTVAKRPIRAVFYAVGACEGIKFTTHAEALEALKKFGLPTQTEWRLCKGLQEVLEYYNKQVVCGYDEAHDLRSKVPYEIDGIVVKVNDLSDWERIPSKTKAPGYAIVHKPIPWITPAETLLKGITVQVGRTGVLTPVAELEPVFIQGSTISRATLHNEDEIRRKDIRIGDTVRVRKAGMVIPEVYEVVKELRRPDAKQFDLFKQVHGKCPACGEPIVQDPQFVAWRCQNVAGCPAQNVRRIEFMAKRSALDIEGIGGIVAAKLVERGMIKEPLELFDKKIDELAGLNLGTQEEPRVLGEKNATKIVEALERAKTFTLARWLHALGIPNVGETLAYRIASVHSDLGDVAKSPLLTAVVELARIAGKMEEINPRSRKAPPSSDREKKSREEEFDCLQSEYHNILIQVRNEIDARCQRSSQLKAEMETLRAALQRQVEALVPKRDEIQKTIDALKAGIAGTKDKGEKKHLQGKLKGLPPELTDYNSKIESLTERTFLAGLPTDLGPVACQSIITFFSTEKGKQILERLGKLGISPRGGCAEGPGTEIGSLLGKSFVLTGTLSSMSRDEASEEIRNRGGSVTTSVSKNTSFLVVGENPGAAKTDQAKALGVQQLTEHQFLAKLNLRDQPKPSEQRNLF